MLYTNCDGYRGLFVFENEGLQEMNVKIIEERYCVYSVSLKFGIFLHFFSS